MNAVYGAALAAGMVGVALWCSLGIVLLVVTAYEWFIGRVTSDDPHPADRIFWRFVIRDRDSDAKYLTRWSLKLPRGYVLRLHFIHRPDGTPCAHDHPWDFWTFCLWGGYLETVEDAPYDDYHLRRKWEHRVRPLTFHYRPGEFRHTITRVYGGTSVTLVLTGPRRRSWGFFTNIGFRDWRYFLSASGPERALWCRDR